MQTPSLSSPTEQPASTRSKRFEVYSEWSVSLNGSPLDPERHAAFEHYARQVAADHLPWVFPLLEASGSKVLISLRSFSFELPDAPGLWIEIPEMASQLQLLPWAEVDQTAH